MINVPAKLHLGCGDFAPEGWLNTDGSWHIWMARHPFFKKMAIHWGIIPKEHLDNQWAKTIIFLDLRKPLPFSDNSFNAVYSSHVLEHIHRNEALKLLKEARRVLCKGGILRTVVPNLATLVTKYLDKTNSSQMPGFTAADTFIFDLHMRPPAATKVNIFRRLYHAFYDFNSHKWIYDEESLSNLYKEAGFVESKRRKSLESDIEDIHLIERPERFGFDNSLIIEAKKD